MTYCVRDATQTREALFVAWKMELQMVKANIGKSIKLYRRCERWGNGTGTGSGREEKLLVRK